MKTVPFVLITGRLLYAESIQVPDLTALYWLGGFYVFVQVLYYSVGVFQKLWPADKEDYVTEDRLAQVIGKIEKALEGVVSRAEYEHRHTDLENKVGSIEKNLASKVEVIEKYLHQREHDLIDKFSSLANKVEASMLVQERERGFREGMSKAKNQGV